MGAVKLFVDDERPAPEGWRLALTAEAAIALLEHGFLEGHDEVEVLSLDHDLGEVDGKPIDTRMIVDWMRHHDYWPKEIYVHTGNQIAERWLVDTIRSCAPPKTLKGYGLNFWGTGPDTVIRNWIR